MDAGNFLGIGIVGIALSFVIQAIKAKFSSSPNTVRGLTVLLAIVIGGIYYFLSQTIWWQTIVGVLVAATTFWAFFMKNE